jgi:predicted phosphoribosyltransferase
MNETADNIVEYEANRQAVALFNNREQAGSVLATMLEAFRDTDAIVVGIPAGGMPVAAAIASQLMLELNFIVVKKVSPPDNTEFGYGAIAADGTVLINEDLPARLGLDEEAVQQGIAIARHKVEQRERLFRHYLAAVPLAGRDVILVDDGLATGITYRTAITAMHKQGVNSIIGAVPTAHHESLTQMAQHLDRIYCANVRAGFRYAVADAYRHWHDISDEEVIALLTQVSPTTNS